MRIGERALQRFRVVHFRRVEGLGRKGTAILAAAEADGAALLVKNYAVPTIQLKTTVPV